MTRVAVVVSMIHYLLIVVIVNGNNNQISTTQYYSNSQTQTQSDESAENNTEIDGNNKKSAENNTQYSYSVTAHVSPLPTLSFIDKTSSFAQVFNPSWVPSGLLAEVGNCHLTPGKCSVCSVDKSTKLAFTTCDDVTGICDSLTSSSDTHNIPSETYEMIPKLSNYLSNIHSQTTIDDAIEKPSIFYINSLYYMLINALKSPTKVTLQLWTTTDFDSNWTQPMPIDPSGETSVFGADISGPACLLASDNTTETPHHLFYGGDGHINITTSLSLILWTLDTQTQFLSKRDGPNYFDNGGVESGPLPVRLKDGNYLFLYNGYSGYNLSSLNNEKHYQIGWLILDKDDPSKIIARSEKPLISPQFEWQTGETPYTCTNGMSVYAKGIVSIPNDGNDTELFRVYYTAAGTSIGTAVISVTQLFPNQPRAFDDYLKLAVFVSAGCAAFACAIIAAIWCKKRDSSVYDSMSTEPEFVSIATGHASSAGGGTGGFSYSRPSTPRTSDLRVKLSQKKHEHIQHCDDCNIDIPPLVTSLISSNSTFSSSQTSSSFCEECQSNPKNDDGQHSPCSNCTNDQFSLQTSESIRLSQISFHLNETLSPSVDDNHTGNKKFVYDMNQMAKEYGEVLLLS